MAYLFTRLEIVVHSLGLPSSVTHFVDVAYWLWNLAILIGIVILAYIRHNLYGIGNLIGISGGDFKLKYLWPYLPLVFFVGIIELTVSRQL